jgi:hypothetical protein
LSAVGHQSSKIHGVKVSSFVEFASQRLLALYPFGEDLEFGHTDAVHVFRVHSVTRINFARLGAALLFEFGQD